MRNRPDTFALIALLFKGALLGAAVGIMAGAASALFLWSLDLATQARSSHPWLLFFLPLAGAAIGYLYAHHAREAGGGTNLILDRIHDPSGVIPFRMAPLVLVTTVATHLFGGSAGREGTAVQMGSTLADLLVRPFGLAGGDRRLLLMAGIAGGFGSVFGTPLAGATFGLEVLAIGRVRYDALLPCLVASIVGDIVCRGFGIDHHAYAAASSFALTPAVAGWMVVAAGFFALASAGFIELTHRIQHLGQTMKGAPYLRPVIGGVVIVAMTLAVGSQDFNGLGIPLIERAFAGDVLPYAFLLKILFTAITLGSGFKGGEVTPLFCIGATLGCTFAQITHQDPAFFAALGFVAVFAGAANTPLACAIMGIELFGGHLAVPLAVACVLTYLLSGPRGIYSSQRVHVVKSSGLVSEEERTLGAVREDPQ